MCIIYFGTLDNTTGGLTDDWAFGTKNSFL